jgi:hypothetical protein
VAKIYETLRKKNDPTIEVYPNIESQNIPNGAVTETKIGTNAVTTGKLANSSVNSNKLADGSVSTTKLVDSSVTNTKIADNSISNAKMQSGSVNTSNIINNAVTTDKIASGSINDGKLSDTLWNWYKRIANTYLIYVGDSDETMFTLFGTFTADETFNEYSSEDIHHAFDFDKPSSSDWDITDLRILKLFIDSLYKNSLYGLAYSIKVNDLQIAMYTDTTYYYITLIRLSTNTDLFKLQFDPTDFSITSYTYDKYIYCHLIKLIDENAEYER